MNEPRPITPAEKLSAWGPGPWVHEPNEVAWAHEGFDCLVLRGPAGALCGYVHVAATHPWASGAYTRNLNDRYPHLPECPIIKGPFDFADCHGGISYSSRYRPGLGETIHHTTGLWVGFDCNHLYDIAPADLGRDPVFHEPSAIYRRVGYVRMRVEDLADQARMAGAQRNE